ncbi:MAG TPA: hypothetical protein DCG34_10760 [Clostridiales bacterium]|jgi:hypothetical protein|nr:hypothetical protein [Clostridiales bacterium]
MKAFIRVENGVVKERIIGYEVSPFKNGLEVDTDIALNIDRYNYDDEKKSFVEKEKVLKFEPTLEERIADLETFAIAIGGESFMVRPVIDEDNTKTLEQRVEEIERLVSQLVGLQVKQ